MVVLMDRRFAERSHDSAETAVALSAPPLNILSSYHVSAGGLRLLTRNSGPKGYRFSSFLYDFIAKLTLLMAPWRISACLMAFKLPGSIGLSPTTKRQFCNLFLCRISRARASRSWSKKSSPDICPLHAFGGHTLILAPIRRRWRLILGFDHKPAISGRYLVNGRDYGPRFSSRSGPPHSSIRHGGPLRSPCSNRSAYR
jgi:hypothetical protein